MAPVPIEEDLQILDIKIKQLKLEYEQYFLGSRKRPPSQLRGEVTKLVIIYSNQAIQNTAARFKFNSLNSRFQAFKRQWDNTLRQIDAGTYERHRFKADLNRRAKQEASAKPAAGRGRARSGGGDGLFDDYVKALRSCGQTATNITPEKLASVVKKQEAALQKRYGVSKVSFRVVVEDGKAKLKASPVRNTG